GHGGSGEGRRVPRKTSRLRAPCLDGMAGGLTSLMQKNWIPSRQQVAFAGRTAVAATLGLLCSILIGLHEPHWAALTVVSVGIPIRGDGLQKAFNRAIGTAIGAPIGLLLVFVTRGNAPLLVGLLAVWLAACVYAGLSLRNYRAYAAVLAGFTAVIIAMSL